MSDQDGFARFEAYLKTDEWLKEAGSDISECETNPLMAAFAAKLMETEERRLNGTFGEEEEDGASN